MYQKAFEVKAFGDCSRCKTPLRIVQVQDEKGMREISYDLDSSRTHVCWDLPEDANLLVLED